MRTAPYKFRMFMVLFILSIGMISYGHEVRHVLYISSYSAAFPIVPDQLSGMKSVFGKDKRILLDAEFMDAKRFVNDTENLRLFDRYLTYKMKKSHHYSLIIVADDDAFNYALKRQNTLFKGIPIVFMGVNNIAKAAAQDSNPMMAGVVERVSIGGTIQLIQHFFPRQPIYVICDGTVTSLSNLNLFYAYARKHPDLNYKLLDLRKMTFGQLAAHLRALPSTSPVFPIAAYIDKNKTVYPFEEGIRLICRSTSAPTFYLWRPGIGDGLLGGMVASHYDQGRMAAQLGMKILRGLSPSHCKMIDGIPNRCMLDYRQLMRFHIPQYLIPEDAIILNKPESFYENHKGLVWTVSCVFLMMALLILFLIINITQRRRYTKLLREEKNRAQESDNLKSAFLANISHEIRTPLNSIIGFSSLLANDDVTAEDRLYFYELIQLNNDVLLNLMNDILFLSRLESGKMELRITRFDFKNFLTETFEAAKRNYHNDGVDVTCRYSDTAMISSDKALLGQIIAKLISNAVKYTDKGTVQLRYKIDRDQLTVEVEDTGVGIAETDHDKVFTCFEKLDTFKQGSGIGLSICRGIINLMGGVIDFKSELGKGTTFWFTIPCNPEKISYFKY